MVGVLVTVIVLFSPISGTVMPCTPCVATNVRCAVWPSLSVTTAGVNAKFFAWMVTVCEGAAKAGVTGMKAAAAARQMAATVVFNSMLSVKQNVPA